MRALRGQAAVMAALLLPVFLMVSTGVIELGNVFSQSLSVERAASAAARTLADLAAGSDLASPYPPAWMQQEASRLVREALGGQAALSGVQVSWGSAPRIVGNSGYGLRVEVPLPQFGEGSTTLRWGDSHGFFYQVPQHGTAWGSRDFQPGVNYGENATYPGWRWADLTNWHWYADSSVWGWGGQKIWGIGRGKGFTFIWVCKFVCFPFPIKVVVGSAPGFSWQVFAYGGSSYDAGRWMGGNYEGAWIPADWSWWWNRRTGTDRFTHWGRWLQEAGWMWAGGRSWPNPGQARVGPYAVYQGDVTQQTTAWPSDSRAIRRTIVISVEGRLRAVTPIIGYLFEGRAFVRKASHDAEKRL